MYFASIIFFLTSLNIFICGKNNNSNKSSNSCKCCCCKKGDKGSSDVDGGGGKKKSNKLLNDLGNLEILVNNKLQIDSININDSIKKDYKKMANEMSEIFTNEFIAELIKTRLLLHTLGICEALDNIINENLVFIPYISSDNFGCFAKTVKLLRTKKKKNNITTSNILASLEAIDNINEEEEEEEDGNKPDIEKLKNVFTFPSGAIFIENEYFKYLRCDGCNSVNCVSCKLKKYLASKGIDDLFVKIYCNIGAEGTGNHTSNIRNIINNGLKPEVMKEQMDNKYFDKKWISKMGIDDNIKKCFFLEWALTIEFLSRFVKIISDDNSLSLYRLLKIESDKITKYNPFESTSIFGASFIGNSEISRKCFVASNVDLWRCIFCYFISPDKYSMFNNCEVKDRKYLYSFDFELEVGYIPINKEDKYTYKNDLDREAFKKKSLDFFDKFTVSKIYDEFKNLKLKFPKELKTLVEL